MISVLTRPRWFTVLLLIATMAISACAIGPKAPYHAFSFDGRYDKWATEVELLAYSYGDQYNMVRNSIDNPNSPVFQGMDHLPPSTGVHASMPVGEFLYVKWRIKSTGEIVEDKVDLRNLLPRNMFEHTVTFVIDGHQLIVYLVTPKTKATDAPPILKTTKSRYNVTYEIYPHNTFIQ